MSVNKLAILHNLVQLSTNNPQESNDQSVRIEEYFQKLMNLLEGATYYLLPNSTY